MESEIKLRTNRSSVGDIAVDGLSLLDVLNVCNLATQELAAYVQRRAAVFGSGASSRPR